MMERLSTDVLALGAGAAGIRVAITSCKVNVQAVLQKSERAFLATDLENILVNIPASACQHCDRTCD
jgi:hypothetical protein